MDPEGKIALVTGGASGIGLAIATELLQQGVKGVSICDLNVNNGEEEVKKLQEAFGENKVIFIKTDVTKEDLTEAAFKQTLQQFGGLDIVINNAGIGDKYDWEQCISVNMTAVARGTMLAFQYMGKDKGGNGGVVANIASILGLTNMAGCPIYVGTKHAVVGLSRSFGMPYHFDRTGVRVITMCPGVTDTPLTSEARDRPAGNWGDWQDECTREIHFLPKQGTENVAKGMMHMIKTGTNGSVWVSEGGKPVYEVQIPDRTSMRVD